MSAFAGLVERYEERDSALHRLDARIKVPAALAYIFIVAMTREGDWLALTLLFAPVPLLLVISRLALGMVLRRSALALPFIAVALPLIFTRSGETVFTMPVFGWTASSEGIEAVVTILAKSWISVLVAVFLTATTPVLDVLRALRTLRVPRLLVGTVFFTYRYFYVIGDEAVRMMRARDSRSAAIEGRPAGRSIRWRATVLGYMVGSLFVRSLERSERVFAAMQARGFSGEFRYLDPPAMRAVDLLPGVLFVAYAVAVQLGVRLA